MLFVNPQPCKRSEFSYPILPPSLPASHAPSLPASHLLLVGYFLHWKWLPMLQIFFCNMAFVQKMFTAHLLQAPGLGGLGSRKMNGTGWSLP